MTYDLRKKITQLLINDPEMQGMIADRFYQRSAISEATGAPQVRPFVVYHMGLEGVAGISAIKASGRPVYIWAHDDPGDYFTIDKILDRAKEVLEGAAHEGHFLEFRYIDRSEDLGDQSMGTILRYARFQAMLTE